MTSPPRLAIFVVDTGPLITLAAAGALDYLLYVEGADIVIPDAVLYEATHDASRLGAADILNWATERRERVEFAPTQTYSLFDAARRVLPGARQPNLGEQAAVEVIEQPGRLGPGERGVLLCEESALLKRINVLDPDQHRRHQYAGPAADVGIGRPYSVRRRGTGMGAGDWAGGQRKGISAESLRWSPRSDPRAGAQARRLTHRR